MAAARSSTSPPPASVILTLLLVFVLAAGDRPRGEASAARVDSKVNTLGTFEVTARLVEIPDGAIFQRDPDDYATILKYEVTAVHRGTLAPGTTIHVAHYNPWKSRAEAADKRAPGLGGSLRRFRAGNVHRLALETPLDDHYMGGILNKYFDRYSGPMYWAVWTDSAD